MSDQDEYVGPPLNKIERRWGLEGVSGALMRVTQWVQRDLDDGYLNHNIVHLVLEDYRDPRFVEIVSMVSDRAIDKDPTHVARNEERSHPRCEK